MLARNALGLAAIGACRLFQLRGGPAERRGDRHTPGKGESGHQWQPKPVRRAGQGRRRGLQQSGDLCFGYEKRGRLEPAGWEPQRRCGGRRAVLVLFRTIVSSHCAEEDLRRPARPAIGAFEDASFQCGRQLELGHSQRSESRISRRNGHPYDALELSSPRRHSQQCGIDRVHRVPLPLSPFDGRYTGCAGWPGDVRWKRSPGTMAGPERPRIWTWQFSFPEQRPRSERCVLDPGPRSRHAAHPARVQRYA